MTTLCIQIASDLHNEMYRGSIVPDLTQTHADLILLAGDIDIGTRGVIWAAEQSQKHGKPVIYVAGNHEYFGGEIQETLEDMQRTAEQYGVVFLERQTFQFKGVRFLGATLWTNYRCTPNGDQLESMVTSARLSDHKLISLGCQTFMPTHALALHNQAKEWLQKQLSEESSNQKRTVVITHHPPCPAGRNRNFAAGPLDGAFFSDLGTELLDRADLWVHGHTHTCVDVFDGQHRLVSNQRGYPSDAVPGFDPGMLVEV